MIAGRPLVLGAAVLAALLTTASPALAQSPSPTRSPAPTGVISGTVLNGTPGAAIRPDVPVQLVAVPAQGTPTAQRTSTVEGRFRFEAPADPAVTYLLRTEYDGVPYLHEEPILISAELPAAHRDLTVWETTSTRPALRTEATVVSVRTVERRQQAILLQREDRIISGADRVYLGGNDRVTFRFPAPDRLAAVDRQQSFDGEARVEGQTVVSTQPLRPGTTRVVTRMVVQYDRNANEYRLRVTAPLPTAQLEVWVPEGLVEGVRAEDGTAAPVEDRAGDRGYVVRREETREGESLVVTLHGLNERTNPQNALTSQRGATIAVLVAAVVLATTVALLWFLRSRFDARASR